MATDAALRWMRDGLHHEDSTLHIHDKAEVAERGDSRSKIGIDLNPIAEVPKSAPPRLF